MSKRESREQQILSIALNEFITKGYYGTSTREIGKIAGLSSGAMFHYFKSKDALYHRLVEIGTEKMVLSLEEAENDPREYLRKLAEDTLKQLKNNEFFAKMFVFIDNALHTSGIPQNSRALLNNYDIGTQCVPILEMGQRKNQIRKGEALALGVAFFGAIQGVAQEIVRTPDTPLPKAEWLLDMICEAGVLSA